MTTFDEQARQWDQDAGKVERALRVAEAITVLAGPLEGRSGLEFGCGTGLLGFALQPHLGRVTLADTSRGMLEVLQEKIAARGVENMVPMERDLTEGPLPDETYDLVFTLMTLHHVPDTDGILARFHALLRPGGQLCVADLDAEDGSFHGRDEPVHKGFDRDDLAARLGRAGFRDVRFATPYVIERVGEDGPARYPIFLAVARRE
jgi:ubiquinone/menaquinone biosynthesis C-methylase UbiE